MYICVTNFKVGSKLFVHLGLSLALGGMEGMEGSRPRANDALLIGLELTSALEARLKLSDNKLCSLALGS